MGFLEGFLGGLEEQAAARVIGLLPHTVTRSRLSCVADALRGATAPTVTVPELRSALQRVIEAAEGNGLGIDWANLPGICDPRPLHPLPPAPPVAYGRHGADLRRLLQIGGRAVGVVNAAAVEPDPELGRQILANGVCQIVALLGQAG